MEVAFRAKEVENIFNSVESGVNAVIGSSSNNSLIDALNGLIGTCQQQEKQFYNRIGCASIEEFNARKQQVGNYSFLNKTLGELLSAIGEKEVLIEDEILNKFFDLIEDGINNDPDSQKALEEFGQDAIGDILKKYLTKNSNLKFFAHEYKKRGFVSTKKVGLASLVLRMKKVKGENKIQVERVKDGEHGIVSDRYLNRINQYLNEEKKKKKEGEDESEDDKTDAKLDLVNFQESVRSKVQKAIVEHGDNEDLVNYVRIKNLISVNQSKAGLIGFIGEVRAGLQFMKLFPGGVSMVGSIVKKGSGQQLPIDVLVQLGAKQYGFQVKNYRPIDGQVQFSNTLSAASFIDGRLALTGSLRELLIAFFGTYQFNQPYKSDTDGVVRYDPKSVEEYKINIFNRYENIFKNLEEVFDTRVGQILKIVDNFSVQGENNPFTKQKNYYNTFFIIGNVIKPSSEILVQIRDNLQQKLQGVGIESFTRYTLHEPEKEPRRQKTNVDKSLSFKYLASFPKIRYDITVIL